MLGDNEIPLSYHRFIRQVNELIYEEEPDYHKLKYLLARTIEANSKKETPKELQNILDEEDGIIPKQEEVIDSPTPCEETTLNQFIKTEANKEELKVDVILQPNIVKTKVENETQTDSVVAVEKETLTQKVEESIVVKLTQKEQIDQNITTDNILTLNQQIEAKAIACEQLQQTDPVIILQQHTQTEMPVTQSQSLQTEIATLKDQETQVEEANVEVSIKQTNEEQKSAEIRKQSKDSASTEDQMHQPEGQQIASAREILSYQYTRREMEEKKTSEKLVIEQKNQISSIETEEQSVQQIQNHLLSKMSQKAQLGKIDNQMILQMKNQYLAKVNWLSKNLNSQKAAQKQIQSSQEKIQPMQRSHTYVRPPQVKKLNIHKLSTPQKAPVPVNQTLPVKAQTPTKIGIQRAQKRPVQYTNLRPITAHPPRAISITPTCSSQQRSAIQQNQRFERVSSTNQFMTPLQAGKSRVKPQITRNQLINQQPLRSKPTTIAPQIQIPRQSQNRPITAPQQYYFQQGRLQFANPSLINYSGAGATINRQHSQSNYTPFHRYQPGSGYNYGQLNRNMTTP
ncbi:hypothetical protein FGO68_gene1562 [Halteria grandinella]|uniref:Uncharacterized protein n=1 Tax=Halteria grandinella TaxID=5974 RepID=A0A8J8T6Z8_HALGN|nr:hypothetical protein FGO68_gene1562 [Halteria grandinella]